MKIVHVIAVGLALGTACVASTVAPSEKTLNIGGKAITIAGPGTCSSVHRPGRELARYLRQYDPTWEAKALCYQAVAISLPPYSVTSSAFNEMGSAAVLSY